MAGVFHEAVAGRERCDAGTLPRHRHASGYLTLVVAGGYDEAGDVGRFRVRPGDLLVHRPFEAHSNSFRASGAVVINLPPVDLPHLPPSIASPTRTSSRGSPGAIPPGRRGRRRRAPSPRPPLPQIDRLTDARLRAVARSLDPIAS